jgi:hypothetical protein
MDESDQKQIERIDHTFELLLVLSSIITTALYEHPGAEPFELPLVFQSLPATLNFLFLPFIILIPAWIYLQTTDTSNIQVFLRTYLWSLIVFHVLLLLMTFATISELGLGYVPVFGLIFWFGLVFPALPSVLVSYIMSSYKGALPRLRFARIVNVVGFLMAWATIWAILDLIV